MTNAETKLKAVYNGPFATNKEHQLESTLLADSRAALEGAAVYFASNAISDANVRARYAAGVKRLSESVQAEVSSGKISMVEGASYCQMMRNRIMDETRKVTSPIGLAQAETKKPKGLALDELLDSKSNRRFSRPFQVLTDAEKDHIFYEIIESAGRANAKVTAKTERMRIGGKVTLLLTGALAGYEILRANDKIREARRQGVTLEGGVIGGFVSGLAISSICGPGAPFCAIALAVVGSTVGATAALMMQDAYLEELKEFRFWGIK